MRWQFHCTKRWYCCSYIHSGVVYFVLFMFVCLFFILLSNSRPGIYPRETQMFLSVNTSVPQRERVPQFFYSLLRQTSLAVKTSHHNPITSFKETVSGSSLFFGGNINEHPDIFFKTILFVENFPSKHHIFYLFQLCEFIFLRKAHPVL